MNLRSRLTAIAATAVAFFRGTPTAAEPVPIRAEPSTPAFRPFMERYRSPYDRRGKGSGGRTGAAAIVTGYRFRTNSIRHVH